MAVLLVIHWGNIAYEHKLAQFEFIISAFRIIPFFGYEEFVKQYMQMCLTNFVIGDEMFCDTDNHCTS